METTIQHTQTKKYIIAKSTVNANIHLWNKMEFYRFGIMPILIVIIGCCGGLAVAFGAKSDILKLSLVAFPTIIALALILGLVPMKVITYVCSLAILFDLLVLIF